RDDAVDPTRVHRVARELGDEIRTPSLNGMWLPRRMPRRGRTVRLALLRRAARQHRRLGGLADDHLCLRPLFVEDARDPLERTARSDAGDPIVQSPAGE